MSPWSRRLAFPGRGERQPASQYIAKARLVKRPLVRAQKRLDPPNDCDEGLRPIEIALLQQLVGPHGGQDRCITCVHMDVVLSTSP